MYKVFIENKSVLFISQRDEIPSNRVLKLVTPKNYTFREIRKLRRKELKSTLMVVPCEDVELAWNAFKEELKPVVAAGGLARNESGQVLMIYRNRRWDLPKGKLKKKESKRKGAIREVMEECGVNNLFIHQKLIKTFHVVNQNGQLYLKKVHWYNMHCFDTNAPQPQQAEGITKAEWTDPIKAKKRLRNTWGTIREVAEADGIL